MELNLMPLMDLKTSALSAESEVYNKSLLHVSYTCTGQILISMKYEKNVKWMRFLVSARLMTEK